VPRYFDLDEAKEILPQVRSRLGDALQLHSHLRALVSELGKAGIDVSWSLLRGEEEVADQDDPEAAATLERARMLYGALREVVESIERLGVEVKGVVEGLVDFRSFLDGHREVLLCWKLGERTIGHYHDLEVGFSGRKPIEGHYFTREPEARDANQSQ
jgi:hypothetical protein